MRHTTTSRQPMVRTAVVAATVCLGMLSSACGGGPSEEPVADAADAEPSSTIGVAETPAFNPKPSAMSSERLRWNGSETNTTSTSSSSSRISEADSNDS